MRLPLIALALVVAVLAAGCLQSSPSADADFHAGRGAVRPRATCSGATLPAAGFDDPNGTPAGAAIVIIEYQPVPGEYVYTLVQPVAGGWAYVYPSGDFVTRLTRDRATFESYRLERIGRVDVPAIEGPPDMSPLRSP